MAFNMYGLLTEAAPKLQAEELAISLRDFFLEEIQEYGTPQIEVAAPELVGETGAVRLHWGDWVVRFALEAGELVREDLEAIEPVRHCSEFPSLVRRAEWIRAYFSSDPEGNFVNEVVSLFEFLQSIEGLLLFDSNQQEFVNRS